MSWNRNTLKANNYHWHLATRITLPVSVATREDIRKMITAKQLGKWIAKWESGPAREKHLFGFLEPSATEDLAEYLVERLKQKDKTAAG